MFLIVTLGDNKYSKIGAFKKYCLSKVSNDGLSFGVMSVKNKKALSNKKVKAVIDLFGERVIFDNNLADCKEMLLNKPDINEYTLKLTKNGVEDLLKIITKKQPNITVTLVDISCRHIEFAQMICSYCQCLKVVTNKLQEYNNFAQNMYEQKGNAVIVTNSLEKVNDSVMIVSPDNVILKEMETAHVPIVTANALSYDSTLFSICEFRVDTLFEYRLDSIDIDQHEYQACIFKYGGVIRQSLQRPNMARIGKSVCSINDLKII